MAAKLKFLENDGTELLFEEHKVPATLKVQKLFRGDAKLYSRKGGSDGDLALQKFLDSLSTWTRDNFCTLHPAQNSNEAYIHVKANVDGAYLEVED